MLNRTSEMDEWFAFNKSRQLDCFTADSQVRGLINSRQNNNNNAYDCTTGDFFPTKSFSFFASNTSFRQRCSFRLRSLTLVRTKFFFLDRVSQLLLLIALLFGIKKGNVKLIEMETHYYLKWGLLARKL